MKNPNWTRDEAILALDLYFRLPHGEISATNPKIVELSQLLNKLPIHPVIPDPETFRNPNGVSLKLSNFLALDPDYKGKGMESYSRIDKSTFEEFVNDQERLFKLASQIRSASKVLLKEHAPQVLEEETPAVQEGKVLYKLHRYRERDRKIVKQKKQKVLRVTGKLDCEVCGFNFQERYGSLGDGFIECHHIVPLSEFEVEKKTQLEDLALVCANCHRMLHVGTKLLSVGELKGIMKW